MARAERAAERQEAQQRLDESEQRFRLLVESVKEYAIFMLDPEGRVATWNAGAQRINGYLASEIIGQHFSRFYPVEDVRAGKCEMELRGAIQDGRFEDEGWRLRKDGSRFWSNVVITSLWSPDNQLVGFAKVTRDLTERRRAEEERIRLAQAQEAIRLRDEFLSIVSHELKTPLAALQLQLENLRAKTRHLDDSLGPRLDRIMASGDRLSDLIESLLDVSRIATGKLTLNPERFELGAAFRLVIEGLAATAEKAGSSIELHQEQPLEGYWDRVRIEQMLTNLLSNALKYGAGAPVEVWLRREGDQAVLEVRDRGPGIPVGEEERIFGRFERSSSLRHYGGMGVGLYVAREVVVAHGGSIGVSNLPAGGAVFTVRVPLAPRLAGAGEVPP
jgi:PAS domain S-box-containing protein